MNPKKLKFIITSLFWMMVSLTFGQYPFEKYAKPKYKEYNQWKVYDWSLTKHSINHTITIDQFFPNKDSLTIQLTSFTEDLDHTSTIRVFRNKRQIQKMTEQMFFSTLNTGYEPIRVADINGDGLLDLKIITSYLGNGIAALNFRIIYFFQTSDYKFTKISFSDMMIENRPERDFDKDGNYEIITMDLTNHGKHNYWTFNLFEYQNGELRNANNKGDYPIMVQFLYRKNYKVTDKIDRGTMKNYAQPLPEDYDRQQ